MCRGEIVDLLESVSEVELPGRREKTRFSGHNEIWHEDVGVTVEGARDWVRQMMQRHEGREEDEEGRWNYKIWNINSIQQWSGVNASSSVCAQSAGVFWTRQVCLDSSTRKKRNSFHILQVLLLSGACCETADAHVFWNDNLWKYSAFYLSTHAHFVRHPTKFPCVSKKEKLLLLPRISQQQQHPALECGEAFIS